MNKRGQIAIFVIIGLVIIVAGILIYYFYPRISTTISGEIIPNNYLKDCINPSMQNGIKKLSEQGGYSKPVGYLLYRSKEVKYLCYTSKYYVPCVVQQPMIKSKFEDELNEIVKAKAEQCVANLKAEYQKKGYEVTQSDAIKTSVEILPEKIVLKVSAPISLKKEATQTFKDFDVEYTSKIYNLLMTATSIVDYESSYGDAPVDLYHQYYPNMAIRKIKMTEGSKIYIIKDVTTNEEFVFATRGLSWPGGYGLEA